MKFTELNEKAKNVAINGYIKGWIETHSDELLSIENATQCCIDTEDDIDYNENGTIGWTHTTYKPLENGDMQLFENWVKGNFEIEIVRNYDEELSKYEDEYLVNSQIEVNDGNWNGEELGAFLSLQEAFNFAENIINNDENINDDVELLSTNTLIHQIELFERELDNRNINNKNKELLILKKVFNELTLEKNKYAKGYDILHEYFDSIDEEERIDIDKRLNEIGL